MAPPAEPPRKELLLDHPVGEPVHPDNLRPLRPEGRVQIVVAEGELVLLHMTVRINDYQIFHGTLRSASVDVIGDEDRDGVTVVDLPVLEARLDSERIVGERSAEDLADSVGVAGVGKRAGEEALELAL